MMWRGKAAAYARCMDTRSVWHRRAHKVAYAVAAAGITVAAGMWQLHLREVEQRAEEAERTRDEVARRRTAEERLRIARELHDSLTHSISVIQIQSGVAVHLARKHGEEVPPALLAIQEAGTDAARELRATLGVLRDQDPETTGENSGLARLDALVTRARSAGLPVTVTTNGTGRDLPAEVDRAAYRIVQEALTNTSRHSAGARATVDLRYGRDCLTVEVTDDGPGRAGTPAPVNHAQSKGLGLIGMRERVSALGGTLRVGPRAEGGFAVRAELPTRTVKPARRPLVSRLAARR